MSTSNEPGAPDTAKAALGKLAQTSDSEPTPVSADTPTIVPTAAAPKYARAKLYAKRTALVIAALLLMTICGVSGLFLSNPTIRQMAWTILTHHKTWGSIIPDPTAPFNVQDNFPPQKRKSLTVLILGSDHDSEKGKRLANGMAVPVLDLTGPGRSDAIMIARFDFDGNAITSLNIMSIPRDTRVRVPGKGIHKINAAHAYGGPELACATVRDVFGIDPDYYIDMNFEGFQQVVDAVGGVDINVHKQLDYDDNWGNLHVHLKPGMQHLNGYKAMGYVRIRHTDNDLARAERQHEFVEAIRGRVTSLSSFLSLPAVVSAITNNLHSSMTMNQMLTRANLARKAPKDAVCLETLPVIEGKTFVYIDRRKSADLVRKLFFKDKLVAVNIHTPDADAPPVRRHKHLDRSGGLSGAGKKTGSGDAQPLDAPEPVGPIAPDSETTSPPPAKDDSGSGTEKQDKSDKSKAPETPKSEAPSGGDSSKTPPKGKDGTGTSSGVTTATIRT